MFLPQYERTSFTPIQKRQNYILLILLKLIALFEALTYFDIVPRELLT
jgi:hypothetical protein